MKTFSKFNKELNEAVVALKALPYAAKAFTKVAPMVAPKAKTFAKFATSVPVGLGIANVLQSKKVSDMSDDEIENSRTIDPLNIGKNPRRKKRKIPRGEQRLRDRENNVRDNDMIRAREGEIEKQNKMIDNYEIIKQELQKRLDKGAEGKFRRGYSGKFQQSDSDLKKKIDEIGKKIKDKKNLQDSYVSEEGAMAVPTNNVGGGQIAGTVEAGDDPPVKKKKDRKKRYIYGGRGSRKMWMKNK